MIIKIYKRYDKICKIHYKDKSLKSPHNEYGKSFVYGSHVEYYINGKLHNKLGPSIIGRNIERYFKNGIRYCPKNK